MKLFKLVNKTNRTMIPEGFNEYTSEFQFNGRVTNLYMMITHEQISMFDPKAIQVANGELLFKGDIKKDIEAFKLYLNNTTQNSDIIPTWKALMDSAICRREAELEYLKHHNLADEFGVDMLMRLSVTHTSHTCLDYLMTHHRVTEEHTMFFEDYMKSQDLTIIFEDVEFVKVACNYLSDEFIESIDIEQVTAKHRYADVRKFLKKYKRHVASLKKIKK